MLLKKNRCAVEKIIKCAVEKNCDVDDCVDERVSDRRSSLSVVDEESCCSVIAPCCWCPGVYAVESEHNAEVGCAFSC